MDTTRSFQALILRFISQAQNFILSRTKLLHYLGKTFFSVLFDTTWNMKFSILTVGTVLSPLCILGTAFHNYFSWFFSLTYRIFSNACTDHSPEYMMSIQYNPLQISQVRASFSSLDLCPVYFSYLCFHALQPHPITLGRFLGSAGFHSFLSILENFTCQ